MSPRPHNRCIAPRVRVLRGIALTLLASFALAGCGPEPSDKSAATKGSAAGPAAAGAPPAVPVRVLTMESRKVPIVFEAVGQTEGSRQVEVRARVGGILERRLYQEGSSVAAGSPLFQIDRAPFELALAQARAQQTQEQARVAQARREAERLKPLAEERAISRKEYDDAVSSLQFAQASVEQATARLREAELNLSYTRVAAPVAGVTGRAERSEGSLITTDPAGSLLTTLNQVDPIWVRFSVSESDLVKLPAGRLGRAATADVQLILGDGTRYPAHGRINFTATQIDPKLGTQQLRAEFPNPKEQLLPGQFVRVRIIGGEHPAAFVVPQTAVLQTEKGPFVFVVQDGKATVRNIRTGEWSGSDWVVLDGLKAGDQVIVDNLLKLRPGSPVAPASAAGAAPASSGSGSAPAGTKAGPAGAPK